YACNDYGSLPYVEGANFPITLPAGQVQPTLWPAAMTGAMYPPTYYKNYATEAAASPDSAVINPAKVIQLWNDPNPAQWAGPPQVAPGCAAAPAMTAASTASAWGLIDAAWGLSRVQDCRDGTANCIMFYEDVGRNESMDGVNYAVSPPVAVQNEYYDPV